MNHPSEGGLALYAGGELGLWTRLRVAQHVRGCDACSRQVEEFRAIREAALAEAAEAPAGIEWNSLAREMRANIRVGLAAGQAIAEAAPPLYVPRWRTPALALPVLLLIIAGWILQSSPEVHRQAALLASRRAQPKAEAAAADELVLLAGPDQIGFESGGHGFALRHPRADSVVFSVRGEAAVRARYVDAETGQVTISHVYAQ